MESTSKLKWKHWENYIQANDENLAEIDGAKVFITNLHACSGPKFELQLCLSSFIPDAAGSSSTSRKANAELRFVYFPIIQGEENTDRITKELEAAGCGIQGFTCLSVRRLGRLLPNACWARLPFMEPKNRTGDETYRLKRCYSRVKCFIETDAGFISTPCKTDLLHEDPYTKALKSFGELHHNDQGLHVQILKEGKISSLPELERQYKNWILNMHADFDEEVVCSDQETVLVSTVDPSTKGLLGITANVVRVCKEVRRKGKSWQSGRRIRILKGASAKFQKTNTYATIEYIVVEGFSGSTGGEAQFICRKRDTPDNMGCILTKNSDEHYILDLRQSVILPLRAIDSGKVTDVEFSLWNKKTKKKPQDSHEAVTPSSSIPGQSAGVINDSPMEEEELNCNNDVPRQGVDGADAPRPALYHANKNYNRIRDKEHKKVCKLAEGSSCEEHGPNYSAAPVWENYMDWWRHERSNKKCFAVRSTPKRVVNSNSSKSRAQGKEAIADTRQHSRPQTGDGPSIKNT